MLVISQDEHLLDWSINCLYIIFMRYHCIAFCVLKQSSFDHKTKKIPKLFFIIYRKKPFYVRLCTFCHHFLFMLFHICMTLLFFNIRYLDECFSCLSIQWKSTGSKTTVELFWTFIFQMMTELVFLVLVLLKNNAKIRSHLVIIVFVYVGGFCWHGFDMLPWL